MANDEIVRTTIQKMRDAGLSDTIIASTLSDLGLSTGQVQGYLSSATTSNAPSRNTTSGNMPSYPPIPRPSLGESEREDIASRTSNRIVQHLEERNAYSQEESSLKDNITHIALEQHGEQLKDTHQAVMDLHEKVDSVSMDTLSNRVSSINSRVEQMNRELIEIKSMGMALQSLMQKILEANQQLLFEMKNRK